MGRTLVLRKCEEHENCQLQSLNGGEERHTPATTPLARRLATKPAEVEELEKKLAGEVGEVMALRVRLGEQLMVLENRLSHLETSIKGMPALQRLHEEAQRLNDELSGEQSELRSKANRLERDMERLARLTSKLEEAADNSEARNEQMSKDVATASERLLRVEEWLNRLEEIVSRGDALIRQLDRADHMLLSVKHLQKQVKKESFYEQLHALEAEVRKEREERLEAHAKIQRQFGEVMKRFE